VETLRVGSLGIYGVVSTALPQHR